jgi:hypothetical protein
MLDERPVKVQGFGIITDYVRRICGIYLKFNKDGPKDANL